MGTRRCCLLARSFAKCEVLEGNRNGLEFQHPHKVDRILTEVPEEVVDRRPNVAGETFILVKKIGIGQIADQRG